MDLGKLRHQLLLFLLKHNKHKVYRLRISVSRLTYYIPASQSATNPAET